MSDVINGVPRELLEFICSDNNNALSRLTELRALLTAQPQASAAQSAPAGEREAFEAKYPAAKKLEFRGGVYLNRLGSELPRSVRDGINDAWVDFQAGAAWQRAQSAPVVPEGWRLVPVEPTEEMWNAGCMWTSFKQQALDIYRAMLAAAPAQPAAQDQGEVQRLREALDRARDHIVNARHDVEMRANAGNDASRLVLAGIDFWLADAALAASTGQEE